MQPVREWLGSLGLSEYADGFDRNRIDLSVLPDLTDQDLKEDNTMKHFGIAVAGIVGALAFTATSASATVVCNENGDC